jgi:hypothetical protein
VNGKRETEHAIWRANLCCPRNGNQAFGLQPDIGPETAAALFIQTAFIRT